MKEKMPYESLERISRYLLLACSVFFVLSVFLLVYLYSARDRTSSDLEAQLLTQLELQSQLLRSQSSDHSAYPHIDPNIGYVLNPHMATSTWRSQAPEASYKINSLGLRGEEIQRKKRETKRIVLLGDSILFGWKLKDEDIVGNLLQGLLAERLQGLDVEVVTVALPDWNISSEKAFLENHLGLLQPDLIVWGVVRNDIEEVSGVVPPGILAKWSSPQKSGHIPFSVVADHHKELPMPAILERWDANMSAIRSVYEKYDIPVVLLWLRSMERPFFEFILRRNKLRLPTVVVPRELRESSSWCVDELDCHPSPWATRIIALGLLRKLTLLDWIPPPRFEAEEESLLEAFEKGEARQLSSEEIEVFLEDQMAKVPVEWEARDEQVRNSVLFGVNPQTGRIRKNGVLFLRDPGLSSFLNLDLKTSPNLRRYPRAALLTVRNRDGAERQVSLDLTETTGRRNIEIPLPAPKPGAVYELRWHFDYASCVNPYTCRSGELRGVSFGG